jgi:membrane protein
MLTSTKEFLQQVFRDFSEDECASMAAALAYATLFALPSLLLIVIFVAGLVLGPKAASGEIEARLSSAVGPQAATEVQTMVNGLAMNRTGGIVATLLGVIGLIVSATGVVAQLQQCINKAWKVKVVGSGMRDFAMKRVRSGLMLVGAAGLAIVSVVATSAISLLAKMLPFASAVSAVEAIVSLLLFALMFAAILKVMPDVHLQWSDVWLGGLFIAVLFVVGKFLIGIYMAQAGKSSVYGAAGSLAMLLMWTYYSALIFLLGVEFTQVWVRRRGRVVTPEEGAARTRSA